ncbi:MAG: hypothetical protein QM500_04430 [Methylococcales bacterium]
MTDSIQDTWNKFERWVSRYKKSCNKTFEEVDERGYSNNNENLFVCKWHEIDQDITMDFNVTETEISTRVANKISFLRGYLVDISFDGPSFMEYHTNFLTLQYPSRCNNAIGVWLDQDLDGEVELGAYFGFSDFDVSFFCKSIEDVDLSSMRGILPFDRMFIRRQKGIDWDSKSIDKFVEQVKEDLEFDYAVEIKIDGNDNKNILLLSFIWD